MPEFLQIGKCYSINVSNINYVSNPDSGETIKVHFNSGTAVKLIRNEAKDLIRYLKTASDKTKLRIKRPRLDITQLRTVKDLNNTNFEDYTNDNDKARISLIQYPVAEADLDRVCELSLARSSKVRLSWSMGELFFKRVPGNNK